MNDFNEAEIKDYIRGKYINDLLFDENIFSDPVIRKIYLISNGNKDKIDLFCEQYLKDPTSAIGKSEKQSFFNAFFSFLKKIKILYILFLIILLSFYKYSVLNFENDNTNLIFKIKLPDKTKDKIKLDQDLLIALKEVSEPEKYEEPEVLNTPVSEPEKYEEPEVLNTPVSEPEKYEEPDQAATIIKIDASKSDDVVLNKEIDKDINWLINQNSDKYVIQLISATKKETITNYLEYFDDNKDIIEFSASISGKKYHILVYGLFDSISLAKANIEKLPKKARQIKPWIRTVESIKESVQ